MLESTGCAASAPTGSTACSSNTGSHVVPAFVDSKTPPAAAPIQTGSGSCGSTAIEVTRPPTLTGPTFVHVPGVDGRVVTARLSAPAGTGSPADMRCLTNHAWLGGSLR